jgi:predicted nucleic acid-binding protein
MADVTSADRLRIYIDTSVLGGCFDAEFATWSNGLVRDFRAGRLIPVLSDVTAAEVQEAPTPVRDLHQEILTIVETVLPITEDVLTLVAAYAARKILPAKYQADMLHIALATVARVDALVSWNFKHIVRLEKIRLFNEVNVQLGHQVLNILSPREVTTYEGS